MGKRTTKNVKNSVGNKVALRKGESIRKDGMLSYRYTDESGKRITIYSSTIEQLREKEKEITANIINGVDNSKRTLTLNKVYDEWIFSKRGIRQNTLSGYMYNYDKYVRDHIGKKKIALIKTNDLKLYYIMLYEQLKLSPRSVITISQIMSQIFKFAEMQKYIGASPCDGSVTDIRNLVPGEQSHEALTKEEQERLLTFVKNNDTYNKWYNLICLLLGTGLRIGEALGLTWSDINFEEEYIDINHTMLYYKNQKSGKFEYQINKPKTHNGVRRIPMMGFVKEALLRQKDVIYCRNEHTKNICGYTNFVFINRYGNPYSSVSVNCAIKNIIRDANLDANTSDKNITVLPDFSPHCLRSTFCTRMAESGVNINVAMKLMGHSKPDITMQIYTTVSEDWKAEEITNLERTYSV